MFDLVTKIKMGRSKDLRIGIEVMNVLLDADMTLVTKS